MDPELTQEQRRMASFCRLCLTKTKTKVPIFGEEEVKVINLLMLIELDIDPDMEPDATVCFDCIDTLEGFFQFKEQCHENDELLKTHPPEEIGDGSKSSKFDGEKVRDGSDADSISDDKELVGISSTRRKHSVSPENSKMVKRPKFTQIPAVLDPEEVERECQKFNIRRYEKGPSLNELQVLQDSYPDFFYFEKGHRSQYYTLVYYGERYNSANFSDRLTYWKCVHRRKYNCKAMLVVLNNYLEFERRHEHSHGKLKLTQEPVDVFTPREALPKVFKICRHICTQLQTRRRLALLERKKRQLELAGKGIVEERQEENSDLLTTGFNQSGIFDDISGQYETYNEDTVAANYLNLKY